MLGSTFVQWRVSVGATGGVAPLLGWPAQWAPEPHAAALAAPAVGAGRRSSHRPRHQTGGTPAGPAAPDQPSELACLSGWACAALSSPSTLPATRQQLCCLQTDACWVYLLALLSSAWHRGALDSGGLHGWICLGSHFLSRQKASLRCEDVDVFSAAHSEQRLFHNQDSHTDMVSHLYESFCEPGVISPSETPCYRCYSGSCWTNVLLHLLSPGQCLLWVYHVGFHPILSLSSSNFQNVYILSVWPLSPLAETADQTLFHMNYLLWPGLGIWWTDTRHLSLPHLIWISVRT